MTNIEERLDHATSQLSHAGQEKQRLKDELEKEKQQNKVVHLLNHSLNDHLGELILIDGKRATTRYAHRHRVCPPSFCKCLPHLPCHVAILEMS